jgi:hypothetical protein
MMLQFGGEQALQLIDGAAYGYHAYIQDLSTKPQVRCRSRPFRATTPRRRHAIST